MKQPLNLYKFVALACVVVYAWVVFQLFARNLVLDTDYSFHMHTVWATSKGFLLGDPFLNGGNHFTLAYGAPAMLLGALIYPLAGIYTVAILLTAAMPTMWYLSRRAFMHLASKEVAELAALLVFLNPFTVYFFLTAKLPFLWGTCLALASVLFYFNGRRLPASLVGAVAVITHPLAVFLLGSILLLDLDLKRWLKPYFFPLSLFFVELFVFFGIGHARMVFHFFEGPILAAALVAIIWLKRELWPLCALGLSVVVVASLLGALGLPTLPIAYFHRLAFLGFLLLIPLAITRAKKYETFLVPFLLVSILGIACLRAPVVDNPEVYRNLPDETLTELKEGYVRYASDGSALYEFPKLGVKFSNAGQEMHEVENLSPLTYMGRIENENASFILVYGQPPDENVLDGWYLEERIVQACGYPLIYSADNLKIYAVTGNERVRPVPA